MYFYLKKFWKDNFSAGIVQISVYGIQVSLNLILMQMFQGIIALDMYRFSRDGSVKREWDSTKPAGVQRNVLAVWNEENREELEIIGRAMEEAQNVITTLLDFSKKSGDEGGMASVSTVINQILLLSPKELITKNVRVKLHLEDRLKTIYRIGYRLE